MQRLLNRLAGSERALTNARTACIEMSRRRAETDEVELFLAGRRQRLYRTRRSA